MSELTLLLASAAAGDRAAAAELLPLVYNELRALATARMADETPGHTLDSTALVHEAYLRLIGDQHFDGRGHFFGAAAEAMRRILVNHARDIANTQARASIGTKPRPRESHSRGDFSPIPLAEDLREIMIVPRQTFLFPIFQEFQMRRFSFALAVVTTFFGMNQLQSADKLIGAVWEVWAKNPKTEKYESRGLFRCTTDGKVFKDGKVIGTHKNTSLETIEITITDAPGPAANGVTKATKVAKNATLWEGVHENLKGEKIPIRFALKKD
jgi:hypothetical protein